MNTRGQTLMLSILFAIFIFILGITLINFLKDDVSTARTNLSCSDTSNISDGTKVVCLFVDITIMYWICLIISAVGGIVLDRLLI